MIEKINEELKKEYGSSHTAIVNNEGKIIFYAGDEKTMSLSPFEYDDEQFKVELIGLSNSGYIIEIMAIVKNVADENNMDVCDLFSSI